MAVTVKVHCGVKVVVGVWVWVGLAVGEDGAETVQVNVGEAVGEFVQVEVGVHEAVGMYVATRVSVEVKTGLELGVGVRLGVAVTVLAGEIGAGPVGESFVTLVQLTARIRRVGRRRSARCFTGVAPGVRRF